MSIADQLAVGFSIVSLGFIAFVLLRYPGFRREFFHHWSSAEVARRLNAFADRLERQRRP